MQLIDKIIFNTTSVSHEKAGDNSPSFLNNAPFTQSKINVQPVLKLIRFVSHVEGNGRLLRPVFDGQ